MIMPGFGVQGSGFKGKPGSRDQRPTAAFDTLHFAFCRIITKALTYARPDRPAALTHRAINFLQTNQQTIEAPMDTVCHCVHQFRFGRITKNQEGSAETNKSSSLQVS
jgi:hypothetical protein